jgi:hypothetical protein
MQAQGLLISVEPSKHNLFNASVQFGRDLAIHLGFISQEAANTWTKVVSKKMVKQSLMQ